MKKRILTANYDYALTHSVEDGQIVTGHHQNLRPAIQHVEKVRHMHEHATRQSNPNGWRHVGSIPIAVVIDWCNRNGYDFSQWARNEDGAKDKFLQYFLSRDFAKLHNSHVTTKRGASQILMPGDT